MLADMHSYRMLFPANAQWSTLYHTYVRLLDVLGHFNALCIDYDVSAISADDTATLQEIVEIATPFVKFINKLEQETRPTISLLFPGLLHLISTLQVLKGWGEVNKLLLNIFSLKKVKFQKVILQGSENF